MTKELDKDLMRKAEDIANDSLHMSSEHIKNEIARFAQEVRDETNAERLRHIKITESRGNVELALERQLAEELENSAEMLWSVVANVNEGDWEKQNKDWQVAAVRWRDNYFQILESRRKARKKNE